MDLGLQAKILRVLQERKISKVGSNKSKDVDVRVVASTNKDLEKQMKEGRFRKDLYYRLNVVPIHVPSLNERTDDIPLIAEYFLEKYNDLYNADINGISSSAKKQLKDHYYEGNVRELENIVERVFVKKSEGTVEEEDLSFNSHIQKFISLPNSCEFQSNTGIFPTMPSMLSKFDGAYSNTDLNTKAKSEKYPVKVLQGKINRYIIYLTPENESDFFSDHGTADFKSIQRQVRGGDFNEVAKSPFMWTNTSDLSRRDYIQGSAYQIGNILANLPVYRLNRTLFTIDERIAEKITPGRDEYMRLLEDINTEYEEFQKAI
jgi:hypothetical protein